MDQADAIRVAAHLKAAYPRMTLDEPETELFVHEIAYLSDVAAAFDAADRIIRSSERFPTVAEFRAQYRAVRGYFSTTPAVPEETGPREIPEWVYVWRWQLARTLTARQAANTRTRGPVEDRPPVRMRDFPQVENPAPGGYSMEEYEQIRSEWVAAGSPTWKMEELLSV